MDEGRTELDRLLAILRARESPFIHPLTAAFERLRQPVHIQVTGRARAGKTTLQRALALISAEETAPIDAPDTPAPVLDADIVLYVLSGTLHPADRIALAGISPHEEDSGAVADDAIAAGPMSPSGRILLVLNKADAMGTGWADAVEAAQRWASELGVATFPVVASLAARTRSGIVTEEDLATLRRHLGQADPAFGLVPERFTSPAIASDAPERRAVLEHWTLPGVACALAALRHDRDLTSRQLSQILHAASGIDPLHRELQRRYERITATRGGEFLDELVRLAAADEEWPPYTANSRDRGAGAAGGMRARGDADASDRELIARYLESDEARALGLRAGLSSLGLPPPACGEPADAAAALAHATHWRAASDDLPPDARRAALRVHDGYVRLWERMTDARL